MNSVNGIHANCRCAEVKITDLDLKPVQLDLFNGFDMSRYVGLTLCASVDEHVDVDTVQA